jgi:hypothetical protein
MKSSLTRRLRVEGLESRTLLAACPLDPGLALGLAAPIDQPPAIMADAQLPAMAETAIALAQQVERPLTMQDHSQAVVSLVDGSLHAEASGVATHLGRHTIEGSGFMNLQTGEIWDSGVITAANGDQIFYQHGAGTVTFTGGTGRFEGVSGGFTIVTETVGDPVVDPVAGTMTMNFLWTATGTINY